MAAVLAITAARRLDILRRVERRPASMVDSLETDGDFFYGPAISHAAARDPVTYYLVSTAEDTLVLAAVGD